MKTFGEFFDEIRVWAEEKCNIEAYMLMDKWNDLSDSDSDGMSHDEVVEQSRARPLSQELASYFCSEMVWMFSQRLQSICTDALYARTIEIEPKQTAVIHASGKRLVRIVCKCGRCYVVIPSKAVLAEEKRSNQSCIELLHRGS